MTVDTAVKATHYDVLGVPVDADATVIKKAYRQLARELHPDLCPDDVDAAGRFALVTAAHAVLADPGARELYDLSLVAPTVLEEPEEERWGEQEVLDVDTVTQTPTPTVSPDRGRYIATFEVNRPRLMWALAWTVVPLVVAFLAPILVGAPGGIFYASLVVAGMAVHRALFSTGRSVVVLVLGVLVAVAMPALVWGDGAVAVVVALITGVPLVVAGELIRNMRSDH